jgi:hypothetical protein
LASDLYPTTLTVGTASLVIVGSIRYWVFTFNDSGTIGWS